MSEVPSPLALSRAACVFQVLLVEPLDREVNSAWVLRVLRLQVRSNLVTFWNQNPIPQKGGFNAPPLIISLFTALHLFTAEGSCRQLLFLTRLSIATTLKQCFARHHGSMGLVIQHPETGDSGDRFLRHAWPPNQVHTISRRVCSMVQGLQGPSYSESQRLWGQLRMKRRSEANEKNHKQCPLSGQ